MVETLRALDSLGASASACFHRGAVIKYIVAHFEGQGSKKQIYGDAWDTMGNEAIRRDLI